MSINTLHNRPTGERPTNRDSLSPMLLAEIHRYLRYTLATTPQDAAPEELLAAASHGVRNLIVDRLLVSDARQAHQKRVAHIALTHDPGPQLRRNVVAMGLLHAVDEALGELSLSLADLEALEQEPSLGPGDPGRNTMSLLESLATLDLPATAYGLRFDYGMFRQVLDGRGQVEVPACWDADRSPWLVRRASEAVWVPVFGRVSTQPPAPGEPTSTWIDWQLLIGVPWDLPVVGHGGRTVQRLRLFTARADVELEGRPFAPGNFTAAVRERLGRESISKVVYTADGSLEAEELRLLQAYFLCAAAVRDVLRVHEERGLPVEQLADTHVFHLEGAEATLTICELQRALVDEYRMDWDEAWRLVRGLTSYQPVGEPTPWSRRALQKVLPRHLQILDVLHGRTFSQRPLFAEGRLVPDALGKVGSAVHEGLADVRSVREWLHTPASGLAAWITETLGPGWIRDPVRLVSLERHADEPETQERFLRVRRAARIRLASEAQRRSGQVLDPGTLLVVHAAPFVDGERPLLALLQVIRMALDRIDGLSTPTPQTWVLAGKAPAHDERAKRVIELALRLSAWLDAEPACRGRLTLRFLPDLDVRLSKRLLPAADFVTCFSSAEAERGSAGSIGVLHGTHVVSAHNGVGGRLRELTGAEGVSYFGPSLRALGGRRISLSGESQRVADALANGPLGDFSDLRQHLLVSDTTHVLADLPELDAVLRAVFDRFPREGAANAVRTLARAGGFTSDAQALHAARALWQLERC